MTVEHCPFCGSGHVLHGESEDGNYMACHNCGAFGPANKNIHYCVEQWNNREELKELRSLQEWIRNTSEILFGHREANTRAIRKEINSLIETQKEFNTQQQVKYMVDQIKHLADIVDQIENGDEIEL